MTGEKAQSVELPSTQTGGRPQQPAKENRAKSGVQETSGRKMSREALALRDSSFLDAKNRPDGPSGQSSSPVDGAQKKSMVRKGKTPKAVTPHDPALHAEQSEDRAPRVISKPATNGKRAAATQIIGDADAPEGTLPKKAKTIANAAAHQQRRATMTAQEGEDKGGAGTSGAKKDQPLQAGPERDDGGHPSASNGTARHREQQTEASAKPSGPTSGKLSSGGHDARAGSKTAQGTGVPPKARKSKAPAAGQPASMGHPATQTQDGLSPNDGAAPVIPEKTKQRKSKSGVAEQVEKVVNQAQPASKAGQGGASVDMGARRASATDGAGPSSQQAGTPQQPGGSQSQAPAMQPIGLAKQVMGSNGNILVPERQRRQEPQPRRKPANPVPDGAAAAGGSRPLAANAAGGAGASGSNQQPANLVCTSPVTAAAAAAARYLPPTGTTPVKPFVPIAIPRFDEFAVKERTIHLELQRQLNETRALYDELKATKIHELEKVLAEQEAYAEERIRQLEDRVRLWQEAAQDAERRAEEAKSEETFNRINDLEVKVGELLREKSTMLRRMAELTAENSRLQQINLDLKAQLQTAPENGFVAGGIGDAPKATDAGFREEASGGQGAASSDAGASGDRGDVQARPASSPVPRMSPRAGLLTVTRLEEADYPAARCDGLQLPTPSPGVGVQFPTPRDPTSPLRGLVGTTLAAPGSGSVLGGVSTECQRVVQMLPSLRAPTPSVDSLVVSSHMQLGAPSGMPVEEQGQVVTGPAAASTSQGLSPTPPTVAEFSLAPAPTASVGVSTEMKRIVGMLPSLRAPTPSASMRAPSAGASAPTFSLSAGMSSSEVTDVTPHAGPATAGQAHTQAGASKDRMSSGSPIDGICDAAQDKARPTQMVEDVSFARGVRAPEAYNLAAQRQEEYSFVDLNPASAQKGVRPAQAEPLMQAVRVNPASAQKPRSPLLASPPPRVASLLGAAGQLMLSMEVQQALPGAASPVRSDMNTLEAAACMGAPINSGSVASNHLSPGMPSGLLARALAHHHELQQNMISACSAAAALMQRTNAQVSGPHHTGSPSPGSANKRQTAPHAGAAAGTDADKLGQPTEEASVQGAARVLAPSNAPSFSEATASGAVSMKSGWIVEAFPHEPEAVKFTHAAGGFVFELREVEKVQGEEDTAPSGGGPQCGTRKVRVCTYTPVEKGIVGDKLPEPFQEVIEFDVTQRANMFNMLTKAVKDILRSTSA